MQFSSVTATSMNRRAGISGRGNQSFLLVWFNFLPGLFSAGIPDCDGGHVMRPLWQMNSLIHSFIHSWIKQNKTTQTKKYSPCLFFGTRELNVSKFVFHTFSKIRQEAVQHIKPNTALLPRNQTPSTESTAVTFFFFFIIYPAVSATDEQSIWKPSIPRE